MQRQNKEILVLAAHPDDETLGCGATLARLSAEGHHIKLITFTDGVDARGEAGLENRNKKLGEICKILGIHEYTHGDFPDNKIDVIPLLDLCKFIESEVSTKPDIVFTHHPGCLNIDHQLVWRATMTAFRPQWGDSIEILSYFVPSSTDYNPIANFNPDTFFDVNGFIENKLEALRVYDEEMRAWPHSRSYENIEQLATTTGAKVGLQFAEAFETMRRVIS